MLEKFEKAALFLQKGQPSTLICHENRAFQKRSFSEVIENAGFSFFFWTENILKMELFENNGVKVMMMWFPRASFSQTQIQTDW